jgi:hypothetical protein
MPAAQDRAVAAERIRFDVSMKVVLDHWDFRCYKFFHTIENVNRHFDWIAFAYDRLLGPPRTDELVGMLALSVRGRLLDAGGGTGRASSTLAHHTLGKRDLGPCDKISLTYKTPFRIFNPCKGKF